MVEFDVGAIKRIGGQAAMVMSYAMMAASFIGPTAAQGIGLDESHPISQGCAWLQANRMYGIGIYFGLG